MALILLLYLMQMAPIVGYMLASRGKNQIAQLAFIPRIIVHFLVSFQSFSSGIFFVAIVAREGSFAGMRPHMNPDVFGCRELLPADVALVLPDLLMHSLYMSF